VNLNENYEETGARRTLNFIISYASIFLSLLCGINRLSGAISSAGAITPNHEKLYLLLAIFTISFNNGYGIQKEHHNNDSLPDKHPSEVIYEIPTEDINTSQDESVKATQETHGLNLAPFLFIILSLFIGTATRNLLSKGPLPYTIMLLIIGLI